MTLEVGLILLLCQLVVGMADLCSVMRYFNGSVSYSLDQSVVPCGSTYAWRINKTVMANEDSYNNLVVQSSDSRNILFHSCQENVSYRRECNSVIISCPYSCPTAEELSSSVDSHLNIIIGIVLLFVVSAASILFLVWWNKDRLKKCFQDRRRCRRDDTTL